MLRLAAILCLFLVSRAVAAPLQLRVATFNASLNRGSLGALGSDLGVPTGKTLASEGDFDNNGSVTTTPGANNYGNDCFGFGSFPGLHDRAVISSRIPAGR
jgi:hypothetical protein